MNSLIAMPCVEFTQERKINKRLSAHLIFIASSHVFKITRNSLLQIKVPKMIYTKTQAFLIQILLPASQNRYFC